MSQQQTIARCNEVLVMAHTLYDLDLRHVRISFDLKGQVAGSAARYGGQHYIRFNQDMLTRGEPGALQAILEDTVPHEIAHLVCFARPELGSNHNSGWAGVCKALGGSGQRFHKIAVVYGRGTTYEYNTDRGKTIRVGDRHHNYIQSGKKLTFNRAGTVLADLGYNIVGMNGRSLQTPIVKNAGNCPAVIEEAVRVPTQQLKTTTSVQRGSPAESKAATSRRIMLSGYRAGQGYEEIITAMMFANGYNRQLARATYKANAPGLGIPVQ